MRKLILLFTLLIVALSYGQSLDINTGFRSTGLTTTQLNALPSGQKTTGLIIRDTTKDSLMIYNGTNFVSVLGSGGGTGDMLKSENLLGLANNATARTNIGAAADSEVVKLTGNQTKTGDLTINSGNVTSTGGFIHAKRTGGSGDTHIAMFGNSGTAGDFIFGGNTAGTLNTADAYIRINQTNPFYYNGTGQTTIYHTGNDSNLVKNTTSQAIAGNLDLTATSTQARALQIGHNRSGNGSSFIDLVGDATYSDYGLRIIRKSAGANTESDIIHRGTGTLRILNQDAAAITLGTTNTTRLTIASNGIATFAQDVNVPDEVYGVGWDGSTEVPTKNAIYDKIQSVISTIPGDSPKKYVARVTQTSTTAPTAIIFEDTSDGWTWSRTGIGIYRATPVGAYDQNRIHIIATLDSQGTNENKLIKIGRTTSYIQFAFYEGTTLIDNAMRISLEIKQYP